MKHAFIAGFVGPVLALGLGLSSTAVHGGVSGAGILGNVKSLHLQAGFKRAPQTPQGKVQKALGGETLNGELAGDWDTVFGVVTYPIEDSSLGTLYVVGLGLIAQPTGGDTYEVPGWHREGYFLDAGDGVPRLLAATLLDADHTPEPGDALFESGQLWLSQYVLYQEVEELNRNPNFYDAYPDGASNAELRFIANDAGQVLQVVVDIYDEFGQYLYSVEPQPGDRYNPGTTLYDLDEPDIVYIGYFFEAPREITDSITLRRDYVVPTSETDETLPEDFDSAELELFLILEGERSDENGDIAFAYSAPATLGYTWGEAKSSGAPDATPNPDSAPISRGGGATGMGLLLVLMLAAVRQSRRHALGRTKALPR